MILETRVYKKHTIAKINKLKHFPRGTAYTFKVIDGPLIKHLNWKEFHTWTCCKIFISDCIQIEKDNAKGE